MPRHLRYDTMLDIVRGVYRQDGISYVRKWGNAFAIPTGGGPYDVWPVTPPQAYVFLSSAIAFNASSSVNTGDDVGAVLAIEGVDGDVFEQLGKVTLNGNTEVQVTNLSGDAAATWFHVYRAYVNSDHAPTGDIYIYPRGIDVTTGVPDTPNEAVAILKAGRNNTQQAIYRVPANKRAYIVNYGLAPIQIVTGAPPSIICKLLVSPSAFPAMWRVRREFGASAQGGGDARATSIRRLPIVLEPGDRVKLQVELTTVTNVNAAGWFDLILQDIPA